MLDAETVITELPPVAGFRLKLTVTPVGAAPAVNVTPAVKPPVRVIVIVLVPLAPRRRSDSWGADSAKSGVCGWVMLLIVAVRVRPPPVPVIVTVAGPSVRRTRRGQRQNAAIAGRRGDARGHANRRSAYAQIHGGEAALRVIVTCSSRSRRD